LSNFMRLFWIIYLPVREKADARESILTSLPLRKRNSAPWKRGCREIFRRSFGLLQTRLIMETLTRVLCGPESAKKP
jgi:hypothetical protein